MTKAEINKMNKEELKQEVLKSIHLAESVRAKDKEISDLKNKIEEEVAVKTEKLTDLRKGEVSDLKKSYELKLQEKDKEIQALLNQNKGLSQTLDAVSEQWADALDVHTSFLKSVEGGLDLAIRGVENQRAVRQNFLNSLKREE